MATRPAQLALLYQQARGLARVADEQAPVHLFSDTDVPLFDTLHVPRAQLKDRVPSHADALPLVLGLCERGPPLRVVKSYVITAELWAQRERLPYIGYDVDKDCYDIVLTALPAVPRARVLLSSDKSEETAAAAVPRAIPTKRARVAEKRTCCARLAQLKTRWVSREGIADWLADTRAALVTAEAAAHYAESALFMLEQRGLLVQQLVAPELAMDRMRHGTRLLFPKLALNRMAGSASYVMSVLCPSMARPLLNPGPGKKPNGADRLGLRDAMHARGSHGLTLAAAWLASEDTFVRYMLSDPQEGPAGCDACTTCLLESLRQTLQANVSHAPWIRALNLVDEQGQARPLGVTVPAPAGEPDDTPWYKVPRALAYRLPAEVDNMREDAETGEWTASRTTFMHEVVPALVDKLGLDVLWTFLSAALLPTEELPPTLVYSIDVAASKGAAMCTSLEETLGRMGHDSVRSMAAWRATLETPLMARNRTAHPLAAPPLPVESASGTMSEELRQWYKVVRDKHRRVASKLPDIEDLLTRDLMPPCMKNAVLKSRADGTLHGYMARFVATGWITDLGYQSADAVKLLGISDAGAANEIAAHARSVQVKQTKVREGQCASWSCAGNMNSQSGLSTDCVMRKRALGPESAAGKIDAKEDMVKVRWACTATLPGYAQAEWPAHAIVHPLDYVIMRLEENK